MELEWALLARLAQLRADGTIDIVGAGTDALLVDALPVEVGIVFAGRIRAPINEWMEPGHSLVVVVSSPARELTQRRETLREGRPPPFLLPGAQPGRLICLPLQWSSTASEDLLLTAVLDNVVVREFVLAVRTANAL